MTIALFAIIGATIKAGVGYWVVFGAYCGWRVLKTIHNLTKED